MVGVALCCAGLIVCEELSPEIGLLKLVPCQLPCRLQLYLRRAVGLLPDIFY